MVFSLANAHAQIRYVHVYRSVDEVSMSVRFTLPETNTQTQYIQCPGSILGLKAERRLDGLVRFRDNKGRDYRIETDGRITVDDATRELLRVDPKAHAYTFIGSPGTILKLTCGPLPTPGGQAQTYTEYFYYLVRTNGNGPCSFSSYNESIATFSCGEGFFPLPGCKVNDTTQTRTCFWPNLAPWTTLEAAEPGIRAFFQDTEPFSNYDVAASFFTRLNTAASQGDAYNSRARQRERIAEEQRAREYAAMAERQAQSRVQKQRPPRQASPVPSTSPAVMRQAQSSFPVIGAILLAGGLLGVLIIPKGA